MKTRYLLDKIAEWNGSRDAWAYRKWRGSGHHAKFGERMFLAASAGILAGTTSLVLGEAQVSAMWFVLSFPALLGIVISMNTAESEYNEAKIQWLQERNETGQELHEFFKECGYDEWADLAEEY